MPSGLLKDVLSRFRFQVDRGKLRMLNRQTFQAKQQLREATREANAFQASISGLGSRIGRLAGFTALSGLTSGLGLGLVHANVEFENLNARLEQITGSSEEAEKATAWIADFAAKTPFSIQEVTSAYADLRKRGIEPTTELMTQLGDVAAAQGKSIAQLVEGAKGVSVGRSVVFEEAIGMDVALKGGRATVKQLDGTTASFEKTFEGAIRYAAELGKGEKSAGGMAKMSKTLGGRLSNLKDILFQVAVAIGQSGLSDLLKDVFNGVIAFGARLQVLLKDETRMRRFWETFAKGAKVAAAGLAVLTAGKMVQGLLALAKAFNILGNAAGVASLKVLAIPAALGLIVLAIQDLWAFSQGQDSLFGRMLDKAGIDPEPIRKSLQKVGKAVQRLGSAFANVGKKIAVALGIEDIDNWAAFLVDKLADVVVFVAEKAAEWIGHLATIIEWTDENWPKITEAAKETYQNVVDIVAAKMGEVIGIHKTAVDSTAEGIKTIAPLWENESSVWRGVFDSFLEWGKEFWGGRFLKVVQDPFKYLGSWLYEFWIGGIIDTFWTVVDAWSLIIDAIIELWKATDITFGEVWQGITDGFLWAVEGAINAVLGVLNGIPDFILDELPETMQTYIREGVDLTSEGPQPSGEKWDDWLSIQDMIVQSQSPAAAQQSAAPNITIGEITVPIEGSVDMSSEEVVAGIRQGAEQALQDVIEATFNDTAEAAA